MARFDAGNAIDFAFDLQDGGTGILGVPVRERTQNIDPVINDVRAAGNLAMLIAPSLNIDFRYLSNSEFQTDGSGTAFGISGDFYQEVMTLGLKGVYYLDVDNLSIQNYFRSATWESVFSGNDQITLGNLNDFVSANTGNDTVYGQGGNDTIEGGDNADLIYGDDGFDTIYAGRGADTVQGGKNGDFINGEAGADDLRGGNGHDYVYGGLGNDTIRGAKGNDTLSGGDGADVFIFSAEIDPVNNVDRVNDYEVGVDKIYLSTEVYGGRTNIGYSGATGELRFFEGGINSGVEGVAIAFFTNGGAAVNQSMFNDIVFF